MWIYREIYGGWVASTKATIVHNNGVNVACPKCRKSYNSIWHFLQQQHDNNASNKHGRLIYGVCSNILCGTRLALYDDTIDEWKKENLIEALNFEFGPRV